MLLRLTRLGERRYETEITRSDGVTYRVKGVGPWAPFRTTSLTSPSSRGWGSVADSGVASPRGRCSEAWSELDRGYIATLRIL